MPSLDMGKKNIVTAIKSSPARHARQLKQIVCSADTNGNLHCVPQNMRPRFRR